MRHGLRGAVYAAAIVAFSPIAAPQLLAFPHFARSNGDTIYSVAPIDQTALDRVTARANRLVAASPLAAQTEPRTIFLTDGGWRWTWLALNQASSLALTRAANETIVVARSDLGGDRMRSAFGNRTLSSIIAHEKCHGLERRAFGIWSDWTKPQWLREGYCDHVGQESTLTDPQALELQRTGQNPGPFAYWQGRKRVEAVLARNGNDVRALFAAN
jgi:hypothetical protein